MKHESSANGFSWVDGRATYSEVAQATAAKFDRDAQLKALMLQVAALTLGTKQDPAFVAELTARNEILADHAARKAAAVPD